MPKYDIDDLAKGPPQMTARPPMSFKITRADGDEMTGWLGGSLANIRYKGWWFECERVNAVIEQVPPAKVKSFKVIW